MNFLSKLLGIFFRTNTDKPIHPAIAKPSLRAVEPQPQRVDRVFVGWNEMIDGHVRIGGYLLAPRSVTPGEEISGQRLFEALQQERIAQFVEKRIIILPVTPDQWSTANFAGIASRNTFFLLSSADQGSIRRAISAVKAEGGRVALYAAQSLKEEVEHQPDMLVFDFQGAELPVIEAQVKQAQSRGKATILVANGVETWAEHRLCRSMGFTFTIGQFPTTVDSVDQTESFTGSRLVIVEMLHQVRAEAPPAQIVATAKRDPAIVLKLLKIGNSPAFGFGRQMSGLEESILVMGRDSLYRWLSIALFKLGNNDGRDQTLLVLALTRGNFLESLAPPGNTTVSEELFLVGLLSVIDVLLGCPLDRVIQQMPLPANLVAVLANDEGPYAPYLSLAITMERCSLVQASLFAAKLKIDITKVIDCYAKAIDFASAELSES